MCLCGPRARCYECGKASKQDTFGLVLAVIVGRRRGERHGERGTRDGGEDLAARDHHRLAHARGADLARGERLEAKGGGSDRDHRWRLSKSNLEPERDASEFRVTLRGMARLMNVTESRLVDAYGCQAANEMRPSSVARFFGLSR